MSKQVENGKELVGKIFKSRSSGDYEVTRYENSKKIHIKFLETGYETITAKNHIDSGRIKDRLKPTLYCVGIVGEMAVVKDGVKIKEYDLWKDMFFRCYSNSFKNKCSTYKDCVLSDNFKYFSYFKVWCSRQVGFNQEGWQLDKDILIKGNKIYSEDTCCFVPKEINMLFVKSNTRRGVYPIGVSYRKDRNKYRAMISNGNTSQFIGHFNTPEEAFYAYKGVKEAYIKDVANKWKDQIDARVYEALMNYQVEITD